MPDNVEEELPNLVNSISESVPDVINRVYDIGESLICGFGIIGNVLSFFMLTRPNLKSPINISLQFLAVFDTLVLVCVFLDIIYYSTAAIYWAYFVQWISWTGSIWTTVGVSVQRYIAVCHPLSAKYLCSKTKILLFNVFIFLCSIIYNLPRVCFLPDISWKGESVEFSLYLHQRYGEKALPYLPSWFFENKFFIEIYYIWLDIIIMYAIPLLSLVVLNSSIFVAARRANLSRREMSQHHQSETRLSNMIFGVIIIFIICYTLVLPYKISSSIGIIPFHLYAPLSYSCTALATINCALNFIIYTVLRKEFREAFRDVFCCFCH